MQYRDEDRLIDYIKEFNDKDFILEIPKEVHEDEINWNKYEIFSKEINFMFCIENLHLAKACHTHGIKYYWSYPVFTWYELEGLLKLSPCYITLGAPLSFSLEKVKNKTNIPLRVCPNLAFDAYIPRENGIYGTWIRPEDIKVYEEYIEVFDFIVTELHFEETLLHIYKDNGNWPGNLNLLFTNFNINVDNRAIPEEIGKMRANCGQRCMERGNCHFCETAIKFSNAIRAKHYNDLKARSELSKEED